MEIPKGIRLIDIWIESLGTFILQHIRYDDTKTKKIELLAPAGNLEKLEIAIHYGADAVYLGGKDFSLRNFSGNFRLEEIKHAVTYAHDRGVKVYVTVNIYARNDEQPFIAAYLEKLGALGPDGVIVADPGIFLTARELIPHIPCISAPRPTLPIIKPSNSGNGWGSAGSTWPAN